MRKFFSLKLSFIFSIFFSSFLYSQITIKSEIKVGYILSAKYTLKANEDKQKEESWLVASNSDAVFKAKKAFVMDSLKAKGMQFEQLLPHFDINNQYNIYTSKNKIELTNSIKIDHEFGYIEESPWNWSVENEFKELLGFHCQKATITKYGRNWIAYYAVDCPFPFGPYKFNNLPGLILEVFDDANDYHFTATSIEKFKQNYSANRFLKPKIISKSDYVKVKKNIESDFTLGGLVTYSAEDTKKFNGYYDEKLKFDNPIELSLN